MYFTVEIIGLEIVSRVKYNIICYSIYFCLSHTLCVFFCVRNNADIINLFAVCLENRSGWHNIRDLSRVRREKTFFHLPENARQRSLLLHVRVFLSAQDLAKPGIL